MFCLSIKARPAPLSSPLIVRDKSKFQADILGVTVERPAIIESTALGAAFLAGLAVVFWSNLDELQQTSNVELFFSPEMENIKKQAILDGWRQAISCALTQK